MKKVIFIVVGIFLVLLLIAGGLFYYFFMRTPQLSERIKIENPAQGLSAEQAIIEFDESYIDYMIFAIGGWKLHNPPLSKNIPKIKVIVDNETYVSEITEGQIVTEKKDIDKEDIIITTSKEELVNAILSFEIKQYIKNSVAEGKTSIELVAGYTTLFSKGYLSLYEEMTGESFTGSVIRIFR